MLKGQSPCYGCMQSDCAPVKACGLKHPLRAKRLNGSRLRMEQRGITPSTSAAAESGCSTSSKAADVFLAVITPHSGRAVSACLHSSRYGAKQKQKGKLSLRRRKKSLGDDYASAAHDIIRPARTEGEREGWT